MFDKYFTTDQLDYLSTRRAELGDETVRDIGAEWQRLIAAMRDHHQRGTPVGDPEVRALAARWAELRDIFHGGDAGVRAAAKRVWDERGKEFGRPSDELWEYVQAAELMSERDS